MTALSTPPSASSPPPANLAATCWWWEPNDLALVALEGADAQGFLHRRTSNDVSAVAVGQGQANTVLERKAQLRALFTLHRQSPHQWWLMTETTRQATLVHELQRFKIMEQFTLAALEGWHAFCVLGQHWTTLLPGLELGQSAHAITPLSVERLGLDGWAIHQPLLPFGRSGQMAGWVLWIPASQAESFRTWLAELSSGPDQPVAKLLPVQQAGLRLNHSVPRFGQDWDEETTLPELGLEPWTVSYSKGCYLGQETIAKVKTYGAIAQCWMGFHFDPADRPALDQLAKPPGTLGVPIVVEGKTIGQLTSWGWVGPRGYPVGLGYLGKAHRQPGSVMTVSINGRAFTVTLSALPFEPMATPCGSSSTLPPPVVAIATAHHLHQQATQRFVADQPNEAIDLLNQAIALDPTFEAAYESLGVILRRLDRVEEAMAVFHRLLALNPEAVMAYTNLSVLALQLDGNKEAAETWKAQGTAVTMRVAMRKALAAKAAAQSTETTMATPPPLPAPVGLTEAQKALTLERIALFEQALTFNPTDPLAHSGLGAAWMALEEPAKALASLRQTVALQPTAFKSVVLLGQALMATGQTTEAATVYRQGIEGATKRGDMASLQALQTGLAACLT